MKFGAVSLDRAVGKVLGHSLSAPDGGKLLNKGRLLTDEDIAMLRVQGIPSVVVAELDADDVGENEAARRVGEAVAGDGVKMSAPGVGRANLTATAGGVLHVDVGRLLALNSVDEGITLATLRTHTRVRGGQLVGLVKIIPFAVNGAHLAQVEAIARAGSPLLCLRLLAMSSISLLIAGPASAHAALHDDYAPPVRQRIEGLGSVIGSVNYTAYAATALEAALRQEAAHGRDLVIVLSVAATMDRGDELPAALAALGAEDIQFGIPVDPGNLLVLGYIGQMAVLGAPGCIKSPRSNVIDMLLPRLLTGERLRRADLVQMGHGGLMEDVRERPMPRSEAET
jgi:molybdenum cofactor cytidylyltransferase